MVKGEGGLVVGCVGGMAVETSPERHGHVLYRRRLGRAAARSMETAACVSAGLEPARRSWPWDAVRAWSVARADKMCVKELKSVSLY